MPTWWKKFSENYNLNSTYDVDGKPVVLPEVDHGDQADMCEIVRTLLATYKMPGYWSKVT